MSDCSDRHAIEKRLSSLCRPNVKTRGRIERVDQELTPYNPSCSLVALLLSIRIQPFGAFPSLPLYTEEVVRQGLQLISEAADSAALVSPFLRTFAVPFHSFDSRGLSDSPGWS